MSSIIHGLAVVVVGFFQNRANLRLLGFVILVYFFNKYLFRYCQIYRLL